MTYNPKVSYTTQDAVVDSTFSKTMLIVGQSNVAIDGLYKDIQRKTTKEIEAEFGADSHLTSCINDAKSTFANSITKPKIWAISYSDEATAVERVLTSTISGDATESKTMLIKINSLNTDRTSAKVAAVLSLRNTKGAFCGEFAQGPIQFGSPVNARRNFNPIFKNPTLNDVVVEVQITSGMTSDEVATAIDDAINAKTNSIYSSSVLASDVTITAKHKGSLGNMFSFEIVPTSIAAGLAATTVETIPGTGVVDTAGILDIEDTEGNKLRNLDFNYLTIPYGYSVTELVADSLAKHENVLQFNNKCLEYTIIRGTALDLSDSIALNALAIAEPINADGITKVMLISELDGLKIKGTQDFTVRESIESKQFTPIQKELSGEITVGNTYTLSNSIGFTAIERVLGAYTIREVYVEKFIPADFSEVDYTTGDFTDEATYNRSEAIAKFEYYLDIVNGNISNSIYGNNYSGLASNSANARANYLELLDATMSFDSITKQLAMELIFELINPIKSIFTAASYN